MAYPYYQPTYPQYGSYYPQTYQPQQMQNQTVTTQNSIIWVSGLAEAQAYPVAQNCAVALWEQTGKTIFLKSADSTGKPTLRIYDLVERTEAPTALQNAHADYATKDEMVRITGAVKSMMSDIEQLKKEIKKGVTDDDA